jgi:membrane protease YdiL (CAAX protease family)
MRDKRRNEMNTTRNAQSVGYKAKAFEPRNLALFFLLVFGLNAIMWVSVSIFGLKMPAGFTDPALPLWLLVTLPAACGPTIAAFLLTAITEGRSGVKALWGRFWNRNLSIKWLLVTLLFLEGLGLATNLVVRFVDGQPYPIVDASIPLWTYIPLFLQIFVATGMGEEFGWRGYVLPRFQAKWSALVSSLVLGLIWAPWHIQAFFIPGLPLYQRNFWEYAPWVIFMSIFITWIFNNTKGSVLAAALFHASMNTPVVLLPDTSLWYYYGILLLAVIVIVIIFGPKDLVRQKREDVVEQKQVHAVSD